MSAATELESVKAALDAHGIMFHVHPEGVAFFDRESGSGFAISRERGRAILRSLAASKGLVGRAIGMVVAFIGDE